MAQRLPDTAGTGHQFLTMIKHLMPIFRLYIFKLYIEPCHKSINMDAFGSDKLLALK